MSGDEALASAAITSDLGSDLLGSALLTCAASCSAWSFPSKAPPADGTVAAVVRHMRDESGVLACTIGHAFEMAPPLTATQDQLDRAVQATARAVHEVAQARGLA